MYIAFIYLVKAFDRVKRKRMWDILEENNVNETRIKTRKSIESVPIYSIS